MRIFETLKGIKLLTLILVVSIITSILSIVFAYRLMNTIDLVNKASIKRGKSLSLAYELKQSASDQTRFARLYVETKHPRYKYYYMLVRDMKNGIIDKPEGYNYYNNFFWDINMDSVWRLQNRYDNFEETYPVLLNGYELFHDDNPNSPNCGNSVEIEQTDTNKINFNYCESCLSFRERMKELDFDEYEFALLSMSEEMSNDLASIENLSFDIVEGKESYYNISNQTDYIEVLFSDPYTQELKISTSNIGVEANNAYAKYLLFNSDYLGLKSASMEPITEFKRLVDIRTNETINNYQSLADNYLLYSVVLSIVSLGFLSTLGVIIFITRQKNDVLLSSLNKKNTYLEHAAKILRHDMHSGINVYIPRGVSSLKRRLSDKQIKDLNIKAPLDMISEGLKHTRKVYKGVYEFTNLVKKDSVINKEYHNIKDILVEFLSHTSYKSQVIIDDNLPTISVNDSLFCTAIDNLIRNGLKYNDSDTKFVKVYFKDGYICVEDNGRGMSQKDFDHLSQPYTRKEGQKEVGTGLGLNICTSILHEHGFSISVEKVKGGIKDFQKELSRIEDLYNKNPDSYVFDRESIEVQASRDNYIGKIKMKRDGYGEGLFVFYDKDTESNNGTKIKIKIK